jgi:hypothetical protein
MFNAHSLISTLLRVCFVSFLIFAASAMPSLAQTPSQSGANPASLRGRIFDADSGQLIAQELTVVAEGEPTANRREMKAAGEFLFSDLAPGRYQLLFRKDGNRFATHTVQVTGLSTITAVDVYLRLPGEINGVVAAKDGDPVQGARVLLVAVEYIAGKTVYTTLTSERTTDDRGYFSYSTRTEAGRSYFLLALPPEGNGPTSSGSPSFEATWYPGRPGLLQPFLLRSSERKRIDFVLEKKQTRCVDGRLTSNAQPAALNFEIAIPEVAGYLARTGGTQGVVFRGQSDASGRFQACGLWPGEFLIAAGLNNDSYGRATVSIVDRDVHDVRLNAQSSVPLTAEIRLDSTQTQVLVEGYVLLFTPLSRVAFESQPFLWQAMDVAIPSQFRVSLLPSTEYRVSLRIPSSTPDVYLKEVMCGGTTSRNSLKLGGSDCGLHITVGTDMGKLSATIVDKDNKNDLNSSVCVYPTFAVTREEIAATGACSAIDPGTNSAVVALRPDRYLAVAMPKGRVDWVEYILANRGQGVPIDIKARSTTQVRLESRAGR